MVNSPEGFEPDSTEVPVPGVPGTEVEPSDNLDELLDAAAELEGGEEEVERRRAEYEAARAKMTSKVRELRASLKFRIERMKNPAERLALIEKEAAALAATFSHSEQMSILKKLMPNRANAETAREKFELIVELGLDMPYWSNENFLYAYHKKFGSQAEKSLDAEAAELRDSFLREFPELEELDEAA